MWLLFFAKITWDIAFGKDDARGNSALPMGNGMMNVITSLPRSARKAEGFWRERRQMRTCCALAVATEESPTLSSRAEGLLPIKEKPLSYVGWAQDKGIIWKGGLGWIPLQLFLSHSTTVVSTAVVSTSATSGNKSLRYP